MTGIMNNYLPQRQPTLLEECLLELLDANTTPEKALKSLSSPCFSPATWNNTMLKLFQDEYGFDPDFVIFLAYTRFILTRLSEACVDGIWEDILRKALMYSGKCYWDITPFISHKIAPFYFDGIQVGTWFDEALSTHSKCPNPYIRLQLFRMIGLFGVSVNWGMCLSRKHLCVVFINTICEIQPHRLHPCGNVDDVLFRAIDLYNVINDCCRIKNLQQIISIDLNKQLTEENRVIDNSNEARFISQCIQIIGVCATSDYVPDRYKFLELFNCCRVLRECIGSLVNCEYLPGMTPWMQFQYVIAHPPFHHHIVETLRDLTAAIINHKPEYDPYQLKYSLMSKRDILTDDLAVWHTTCTLPKLLLSRQVQGPTLVRQHSLLLRSLDQEYLMVKNSVEDNDIDSLSVSSSDSGDYSHTSINNSVMDDSSNNSEY